MAVAVEVAVDPPRAMEPLSAQPFDLDELDLAEALVGLGGVAEGCDGAGVEEGLMGVLAEQRAGQELPVVPEVVDTVAVGIGHDVNGVCVHQIGCAVPARLDGGVAYGERRREKHLAPG